jgi:hypothetical protein
LRRSTLEPPELAAHASTPQQQHSIQHRIVAS